MPAFLNGPGAAVDGITMEWNNPECTPHIGLPC